MADKKAKSFNKFNFEDNSDEEENIVTEKQENVWAEIDDSETLETQEEVWDSKNEAEEKTEQKEEEKQLPPEKLQEQPPPAKQKMALDLKNSDSEDELNISQAILKPKASPNLQNASSTHLEPTFPTTSSLTNSEKPIQTPSPTKSNWDRKISEEEITGKGLAKEEELKKREKEEEGAWGGGSADWEEEKGENKSSSPTWGTPAKETQNTPSDSPHFDSMPAGRGRGRGRGRAVTDSNYIDNQFNHDSNQRGSTRFQGEGDWQTSGGFGGGGGGYGRGRGGGERGRGRGRGRGGGGGDHMPSSYVCYGCGKPGHFRRECPEENANRDSGYSRGYGGDRRGGGFSDRGRGRGRGRGGFEREQENENESNQWSSYQQNQNSQINHSDRNAYEVASNPTAEKGTPNIIVQFPEELTQIIKEISASKKETKENANLPNVNSQQFENTSSQHLHNSASGVYPPSFDNVSFLKPLDFDIHTYKGFPCQKENCNMRGCLEYHNAYERRRFGYQYQPTPCPRIFVNGLFQLPSCCPNQDKCMFAHTKNEIYYHKDNFRKKQCIRGPNCRYGKYCPDKHAEFEFNPITEEQKLVTVQHEMGGQLQRFEREYHKTLKRLSQTKNELNRLKKLAKKWSCDKCGKFLEEDYFIVSLQCFCKMCPGCTEKHKAANAKKERSVCYVCKEESKKLYKILLVSKNTPHAASPSLSDSDSASRDEEVSSEESD